MNDKLLSLKNKPLSECKRQIGAPAKLQFGNDYDCWIKDYSKEPDMNGRIIQPYVTNKNHPNAFIDIPNIIEELKVNDLLDLGCGNGELLFTLKDKLSSSKLYGVTIHLGEVKYARENYGLGYIFPMDMREIDEYFEENSLEAVIAHASFNFIPIEDRINIIKKVHKILKPNYYFIFIDYKQQKETQFPRNWNYIDYFEEITLSKSYYTMGTLTILKKKEI